MKNLLNIILQVTSQPPPPPTWKIAPLSLLLKIIASLTLLWIQTFNIQGWDGGRVFFPRDSQMLLLFCLLQANHISGKHISI